MAAFTELVVASLQPVLERLFVEPVVQRLQQISDGIENSNYLVVVSAQGLRGRIISGLPDLAGLQCSAGPVPLIVTIVEMLDRSQLDPIVKHVALMANAGLPVPGMFADELGESVFTHAGKPLMVVPMLEGRVLQADEVQPGHCRAAGSFLGALHSLTLDLGEQDRVERGFSWTLQALDRCQAWVEPEHGVELKRIHARLSAVVSDLEALPMSWTHGDLFIDNALFRGDEQATSAQPPVQLSGIIDFYRSGPDSAALDLAIAANDWCWDGTQLLPDRIAALFDGYESHRSLTTEEKALWPELLGFAAARFYAARMLSLHTASYQRQAADADPSAASVLKDPSAMLLRMTTALFPD
ncbi:homoserine kinase [Allohahella marinimesophila]|uniref:Homoserine kinase n=1 Tax=Allohahella marinimesophila TaxID=1054972 RepID=A0ABP7PA59_9GAMM